MNELDQFAQETEVSIVDKPITDDTGADTTKGKDQTQDGDQTGGATDDGEETEEAKNRRERRLLAKLQAEREANIDLAARLQTISESKRFASETEQGEYLKAIDKIYGTDTPEAAAATELLKGALVGLREDATNRALETFRAEQRERAERDAQAERELDRMVETIEDEFNVQLTPQMERGFFTLLEKMSPKDDNGDIVAYADPVSVWETYSERLKKRPTATTDAKALASRGMTQSGGSSQGNLQDDAALKVLREAGIL